MVSSSTFRVGRDLDALLTASSAEDSFLPGDGGPARVLGGGSVLMFVLPAPAKPGAAIARVRYYFRGAVIQFQLLSAQIGGEMTAAKAEPWSPTTPLQLCWRQLRPFLTGLAACE